MMRSRPYNRLSIIGMSMDFRNLHAIIAQIQARVGEKLDYENYAVVRMKGRVERQIINIRGILVPVGIFRNLKLGDCEI